MTDCPLCVHNSDARAEAAAALAVAQKELADLHARCETAETGLKAAEVALAQAPTHPPGLCGLDTCEPCNAEIQGIIQSVVPLATAEGRRVALADVRQALTWGGGEALADKVTQYAQAWVQKGRPEPAREPALVIMG